jgi:hypothetical protein
MIQNDRILHTHLASPEKHQSKKDLGSRLRKQLFSKNELKPQAKRIEKNLKKD